MIVLNFIVVGIVLAVLQTTIFMPTPVWFLAPDLYYVLVAYLAFRLDLVRSLIILFPLVCVLDVLSGTILGMYALICFSGHLLLRLLFAKLPIKQYLYQIPLVGLSYPVVTWVVYLLLELLEPGQQVSWYWWKMIVRAMLVTVISYPMFLMFDWLQKQSFRGLLPWNRLRLRADNRRRRQA
jgi:rod shape-determining protein MreD